MVGHGGSSASSYLADPTSPIPSHCTSIVTTSTLRVKLLFLLQGDLLTTLFPHSPFFLSHVFAGFCFLPHVIVRVLIGTCRQLIGVCAGINTCYDANTDTNDMILILIILLWYMNNMRMLWQTLGEDVMFNSGNAFYYNRSLQPQHPDK